MNALQVNAQMSLFQNQSMTFVIVGHIIVKENQQNMLLHQYLLMIPMYDMFNNIYVYRVTNDIFSHIRQVTKLGFPSSVCFP